MRAHVFERRGIVGRAQRARAGTDSLAAKAEPAIDRADRHELDQHPVGIAMHQSLHGAHGVVADRVVALGRIADKLAGVGDELTRDRIGEVARPNKGRERRRNADCVAVGDCFQFGEAAGLSEPGFDQGLRGCQALSRSPNGHGVGQAMPAFR